MIWFILALLLFYSVSAEIITIPVNITVMPDNGTEICIATNDSCINYNFRKIDSPKYLNQDIKYDITGICKELNINKDLEAIKDQCSACFSSMNNEFSSIKNECTGLTNYITEQQNNDWQGIFSLLGILVTFFSWLAYHRSKMKKNDRESPHGHPLYGYQSNYPQRPVQENERLKR